MKNPFTPNFGNVPSIYLDREELAEKVADGIRRLSESPYQTTLIYGHRGCGIAGGFHRSREDGISRAAGNPVLTCRNDSFGTIMLTAV